MASRRRNRNLVKRGGVYYVEAVVDGHRIKRSLKTRVLDEAKRRRDSVLREERARRATGRERVEAPTFAVAAAEALKRMKARREAQSEDAVATTTATGHRNALAPGGPILPHLGHLRLDAIDPPTLRRWWESEIFQKRRSAKSGRNYLGSVEMVLREARAFGQLDAIHRPVQEFREGLNQGRRTKSARAAKDAKRQLAKAGRLTPEEFGRLTKAAREDRDPETTIVVLLAGEHGLRHGELSGLRWGDIVAGTGPADPGRHLFLQQSLSGGMEMVPLKSGHSRKVPLSRRLAEALLELRGARMHPSPRALVLETPYFGLEPQLLRRACDAAGLGKRTFQNLRSTASSLLKEWGVPETLVRVAIGHESEAVAAEFYDRIDVLEARPAEIWDRSQGENFLDLFARLCSEPSTRQKSPHQSPHPVGTQQLRVVGGKLNGPLASWSRRRRPPPGARPG